MTDQQRSQWARAGSTLRAGALFGPCGVAQSSRIASDAQMIDAFVGEPDMIGQGHGSAFLRELAQMLIAEGAPAVAIDPDAKNERARRAYARAGFEGDEIVNAAQGPVALMVFRDR